MNLVITMGVVVTLGILYVLVSTFVMVYREARGTRVVRCPETLRPTQIELDPRRSALSAAMGRGRLYVQNCARWPAHWDCDQDCMRCVTPDMAQSREILVPPGAGVDGLNGAREQ